MKIATKLIRGIIVVFSIVLVQSGCDKKTIELEDKDTSAAEDNAIAEDAFSDVFRDVNENSDSTDNHRSACPIITVDTTINSTGGYPRTLTIDYGTGCNGKKGSVVGVFSGAFRDSASVITITYNNYYSGDYKVNATTHTIQNSGRDAGGSYIYNINIAGATLVGSDGTIAWNATKTIKWLEGRNTATVSDDVFLLSGTRTGTSASGVNYTVVVSNDSPLKMANSCQWIQSGIATLTPEGKKPRTIDFGSGTCDNDATVTIGGATYNVKL